jgi:hypothetical protein
MLPKETGPVSDDFNEETAVEDVILERWQREDAVDRHQRLRREEVAAENDKLAKTIVDRQRSEQRRAKR